MMVLEPIRCPNCDGVNVGRHGKTTKGKQRFICKESDCQEKTFIREYSDKGRLPETKQKIIEMAVNGSGVRDTARVLNISTATVIKELKKGTRVAISESGIFGYTLAWTDCRRHCKNR